MPDPITPTATTVLATPSPASSPPVPAAPSSDVLGQLRPEDPILVRDKTGATVSTKLGDLADAWRNRPDPADVEDLTLFRKAIKDNDFDAAQKLASKYMPGAAPPATPPAIGTSPVNVELVALQSQVKEMKEALEKMSPTTTSVREALEAHQLTMAIDATKEMVPLLVRHPDRAALVKNRLLYYADQAKAHNLSLDSLPLEVRSKVYVKALTDVEASLRATLEIYGMKPAGAPPARNVASMNDQGRSDERMVREPRYKLVNGQLVDTVQPAVAAAAAAPLPTAPVTPVPTGGMVGVEDGVKSGGRVTPSQLLENMRRRSEALSQVV